VSYKPAEAKACRRQGNAAEIGAKGGTIPAPAIHHSHRGEEKETNRHATGTKPGAEYKVTAFPCGEARHGGRPLTVA
jgi:hypothetical protein